MEVFFAAAGVMVVSLSGVLFTSRVAQTFLLNRLSYLVSFSAGVFLVTAGALALEVFHIIESFWLAAGLIMIGYGGAWLLQWFWPETHHHHDDECGHDKRAARTILVGDGIHNVADGVVLAVAYAAAPALGIAATVSIIVHETLQEIAEFFVLRRAGYSTTRALLTNFAVSSTILLGVGLGVLAISTIAFEGVLLALSAGFFTHVVLHDLLPKPHHHETRRESLLHFALLLVGLVVMGLITLALGDSHEHSESAVHEEGAEEHSAHDEH